MSDDDRRPQYGELASPEEQRAHIRDPKARDELAEFHRRQEDERLGRASAAAQPGAGGADRSGADRSGFGAGPAASVGPGAPDATPGARVPHRWDLILTLLLLAVGLVNVLTSIPGYLGFADTLGSAYSQLGIGEAPHGAAVAGAGHLLIVIEAAVWAAAALVSWLSLRARRISFWIPIVGAIVAYIGVVIVVLTVVLADPAFQDFIRSAA